MKILTLNSDVNLKRFSKQILKNELKIIKKYPATDFFNRKTDGDTGLGYDSLTSRFFHFNVLNWLNTSQLRKEIRKGYESYNNLKNTPLFVQCWANVMRKGDRIKPHTHHDFNLNTLDGLSGHLCVKVDGSTNTYYGGKPIQNKNREMTFFPMNLSHWTDRYEGDDVRITVAFDIHNKKWFDYNVFDWAKKHWIEI